MADDNRFSGLGEALDEDDEAAAEADEAVPPDTAAPEEPQVAEPAQDEHTTRERAPDPKETPAFAFSEAEQNPLYPRAETWQDLDDVLDFEVRRELREDDYQEIAKRELHEATLRVAIEHPELVAEEVRRQRCVPRR